ncbi:hypothetical protein V496_08435 [Pseudogymnoascus sp. VKM F-4515 (FW-2607)]|nr:hypothetical protein V496_08435 [Pseudogymnoascus sp. VKM F-4515 (FW-2607)]
MTTKIHPMQWNAQIHKGSCFRGGQRSTFERQDEAPRRFSPLPLPTLPTSTIWSTVTTAATISQSASP